MRVALVSPDELDPYLEHMERQVTQSGREGLPIFNPFPRDHTPDMERFRLGRETPMTLGIDEIGWRRMWGAWDGGRCVGGAELSGGRIAAEMHRVGFTIGIEKSHHRRGLGVRLAEAAIEWARAEPSIAWVDLGVFSHNAPAIALYEKVGFRRNGVVEDRFRVDGEIIDDVQMSLDVSA